MCYIYIINCKNTTIEYNSFGGRCPGHYIGICWYGSGDSTLTKASWSIAHIKMTGCRLYNDSGMTELFNSI